LDGILNILKAPGMTSQNVVTYVKKTLKADKAGHTGTLDPGAAGVLPVCIGKATRISEYLLNDKKTYRAEMRIGLRSDTLDKYGNVENIGAPILNDAVIKKAVNSFKGPIQQVPPMFSAIKREGVRLYELARKGIEVERPARDTYIYDIIIINVTDNTVLFDVTCAKGTYIRSLCSDIGKSLGYDAIMTFLIRTGTGPFRINESITLDELRTIADNNEVRSVLHPIEYGLEGYGRIYIDKSLSEKVKNGNGFGMDKISKYEPKLYNNMLLVFDNDGSFIAVGSLTENGLFIKIDKVFA
jgi:tRNA pseudouridine 55 synthase